ncbi:transcriptional regulator [bacterium]|nr:MAG: transcriptional regulator [bacterium]
MSETQQKIFRPDCAAHLLERQVFSATCPGRILLEQIGDKWSVLILAALNDGPLRFNAIKRSLEGVTQKALTQSLRRLERNGIIERRVIPVSPVGVEYEITPLGRTLDQFFLTLYGWTAEHLPELEKARQEFDSRARGEED